MSWTFDRKNRNDLGQVAEFYPAYLARYTELREARQYPYNDSFKGHIPGIEGPDEDRAIYMLQTLHRVREMEATIAERRADGWRDLDPAEVSGSLVRFAGVAQYGFYVGGTGWQEWERPRLTRVNSSLWVIPAGKRTHGHMISGRVLVKD